MCGVEVGGCVGERCSRARGASGFSRGAEMVVSAGTSLPKRQADAEGDGGRRGFAAARKDAGCSYPVTDHAAPTEAWGRNGRWSSGVGRSGGAAAALLLPLAAVRM